MKKKKKNPERLTRGITAEAATTPRVDETGCEAGVFRN